MEKTEKSGAGGVDDLLCFAVYSTLHAFNQFYRPLLDELGLTYPQYLVMTALWDRDGRTVKELGEALHLESNTLTPILKRLESRGLLARVRDQKDERQVRLRLTGDGTALQERAAKVPLGVRAALGLDNEEMASLLGSLSTVRDRLLAAAKR